MAFRSKAAALVLPLLLAGGIARADEQCSGTLCDLYYGSKASGGAENAPAAAPHVMTAPANGNPFSGWFSHTGSASASGTQAAPAPQPAQPASADAQPSSYGNSLFHVGGGGVASRNSAGECGGTLCNLFHGHSSDSDAEPMSARDINGVPASSYDASARPSSYEPAAAASAAPAAAPAAEAQSYAAVAPLPRTAPSCAHSGKDPWSCYRR